MNIYAVCERFVEEACNSKYFAFNVLYRFIMDSDLRVAFDADEEQILKRYLSIGREKRSKEIQVWARNLIAERDKNLERVPVKIAAGDPIAQRVAEAMRAPRQLVAWSTGDYPGLPGDILVLDRYAAKAKFAQQTQYSSGPEGGSAMTTYKIDAGHGSNIIISSTLKDSVHHLNTAVSEKAAATLKATADCVEASGDEEAGHLVDRLAAESAEKNPKVGVIQDIATQLFARVPDLVKVVSSAADLAKILTGSD